MKNRIFDGDVVTVAGYGADVAVDTPILIGSLFGLAQNAIKSGGNLVLVTKGGFTGQPKATGETWAVGDVLYWDDTGKKFTKTSAGNKRVGLALSAQATGDIAGDVRIGLPGAI